MTQVNGFDLAKKLASLDLQAKNLSINLFHAWFDTDCKDTLDFLTWLCLYVGEENLISATELEEYKGLTNETALRNGTSDEIQTFEENYPGLLDLESNEFELEYLSEEKLVLLEEERQQQKSIDVLQKLNRDLTNKIAKENDLALKLISEEDKARETCMCLSQRFDETNTKLHEQIMKYGERLNNFEYTNCPTFVCGMPIDQFNQYHNDIVSYVSISIQRERDVMSKLGIIATPSKKTSELSFEFENNIISQSQSLAARIRKSLCNKTFKKVKEVQLYAEMQHMEKSSTIDVALLNNKNYEFQLEANIYSKKQRIDKLFFDLESVIKTASKNYVDAPKLHLYKKVLEASRKQLNYQSQLEKIITKILSHHHLLNSLVMKERDDIKGTDKFFKDIHMYIAYNLDTCQTRTELMLENIQDHNKYCDLPIEEKYSLVQQIGNLLITDDIEHHSLGDVLERLNSIQSEFNSLNQTCALDGSLNLRKYCENIEKHIQLSKQFLCNGPSRQAVLVPYKLKCTFEEVDLEILSFKDTVLSAVELSNKTEAKLEKDRWLKIYRQIWMYFLVDPSKMLCFIENLESEAKKQWIKSIK